jgi:PAS domain S-box-containing protein
MRSFLDGGGELGEMMRRFDWCSTPLGDPQSWPRSLKTAVRILLTSRQPMWLGWGPALTYLYNDPYKSIIGGKHPWALGRPFSEVWREIWDVVGPMAEHVMSRDEGTYVEAQLLIMERHGYQEETYYTFSYSPVSDDEGVPAGIICANTDDTRRVIGERQLALLGELAARTSKARRWKDACDLALEAFATNALDLPFAMIYAAEPGTTPVLAAATAGTQALHDLGHWPWQEVMLHGEAREVAMPPIDGPIPTGGWDRAPRSVALLPIAASGSGGRAGMLVAALSPYRRYDEGYRGFLELVAGQISAAIANSEAYEEERKRAEALAELDRAKTAFFSNVSHEFRTPLTLLLGPVEELLAGDEVRRDARPMVEMVRRNAQRLLKLVNTLLDFARIEAGRAQSAFEATDLPEFTADLASNFRAACERAGLRLVVDCPPAAEPAWVDREMWEKVVLNLLSNAFKFTLHGEIRVTLRAAAHDFTLAVSDTGIGIPEAALPRMFERFHRVEGAKGRSHEGSGIGLALVHELVKLHGGRIAVQSEPGRGTTFTVSIPRGHAHLRDDQLRAAGEAVPGTVRADAYVNEALGWLGEAQPQPAPPPPAAPRRVLLADDNADLRDYARRLLADEYEVETAEDGEQALAAVRARPPDIVISDVMMPKLDGFGLVARLRADPQLRSVPVILLSARAGEEARVEGIGSGADDYLTKPFSARELLVRVGSLVRSAEARRKAREELERHAAQLEALVNTAPLGVYLVDDALRIAAVNPVAAPHLGERDLVGSDFRALLRRIWPLDAAEAVIERFQETLRTGEPYVVPEWIARRCDHGAVECYEWQIHRLPLPGGRYGVVCYFRDISAAVAAREALVESDRRKDEFLATLSHELRNPLTPLRNSLRILQLGPPRDPSTTRVHEMMERQVDHLVRLVDDLLEMSRISRGALELRREPVEVATIVRNALETSEPLVLAARHRLDVHLPGERLLLHGDPVRLAQLLANLLNNAAKYTDPGGRIELSAWREDDLVAIRVRDNGRGIAPHELARIFEIFVRGEDERAQGGLGIGLALARQLARMHGGTLEAHSAGRGKGSDFTLRLPLSQPQAGRDADAPRAAPARPIPRRILVVDDNRDAAESLAMILGAFGAETRVAFSGPEAIGALESFAADVALLDIGMPDMDGYETARRVRARFADRGIALVALTGWGQEQDRRRSREAGFAHHIVKPPEIEALRDLLASIAEALGAAPAATAGAGVPEDDVV